MSINEQLDFLASLGGEENKGAPEGGGLVTLQISAIERDPEQPRNDLDEPAAQEKLKSLAVSMKDVGQLEPILVREIEPGRYMLIAGERRWRAMQIAGLNEIKAIVRNDLSDSQREIAQLVENVQRESLSDIDEAKAIQRLIDKYDLKKGDIANLVGRSASYISRMLATLHPEASALFADGVIDSASVLETFRSLPQDIQDALAQEARESGVALTRQKCLDAAKATKRAEKQKLIIEEEKKEVQEFPPVEIDEETAFPLPEDRLSGAGLSDNDMDTDERMADLHAQFVDDAGKGDFITGEQPDADAMTDQTVHLTMRQILELIDHLPDGAKDQLIAIKLDNSVIREIIQKKGGMAPTNDLQLGSALLKNL